MLYILLLVITRISYIHSSNCDCSLIDLEEQEKLNRELFRFRIEYPNGLNKYQENQYNYQNGFECGSVAIYEYYISYFNVTSSNKQCKKCTQNGWTNLMNCESEPKCDRDQLIGQPVLHLINLEPPPVNQKLFRPGQVVVVYKHLNYKVCKICQTNGEWSKYPDESLCNKVKILRTFSGCSGEDLKQNEKQQPEYIRLRIESSNGMNRLDLDTQYSNSDLSYPDGSVVLYQTYLSNFARLKTSKDFNPSSSFVKKSCRYCVNGIWSDLESCTSLNCDRNLLTGSPDLQLLTTYSRPADDQILFKPNSVIASYSFGNILFCKQCHENGEWSRYPSVEICPNTSTFKYFDTFQIKRPLLRFRTINDDVIFNNELPCSLNTLVSLENKKENSNFTRLYLVSDLKQKLNPQFNAKIPSRSLGIYEKANSKINFCSICINGYWSSISERCSENTNINFCERSKLTNINNRPMKIIDIHYNKVSESQEIFEPGSVIVIYEFSETTRLCKICEETNSSNAQWSLYPEGRLCSFPLLIENNLRIRKFSNSCNIDDLNLANETRFTKESIMNWDAKNYLTEEETSIKVPDYSMAIFTSKLTNIKYCRRCNNGKWADEYKLCPIEFSIKKCDPFVIRGANYFVNKFDGLKLLDNEKNNLVMPGNVIAVYQFGPQRFCKECLMNGTWSRFPETSLCKNLKT